MHIHYLPLQPLPLRRYFYLSCKSNQNSKPEKTFAPQANTLARVFRQAFTRLKVNDLANSQTIQYQTIRAQRPPMEEFWAKKLQRGCAIWNRGAIFLCHRHAYGKGQRPCAAKKPFHRLEFLLHLFQDKTAKPS